VETHAYVLDFMPGGRQTERGFHREPVALGLGETELKIGRAHV
jgi:predicted nucleic acid-binding OB-fold protein